MREHMLQALLERKRDILRSYFMGEFINYADLEQIEANVHYVTYNQDQAY